MFRNRNHHRYSLFHNPHKLDTSQYTTVLKPSKQAHLIIQSTIQNSFPQNKLYQNLNQTQIQQQTNSLISDINFEEIYDPLIPFFLRNNYCCDCLHNFNCCKKLSTLILQKKLNQMKEKYYDIKNNVQQKQEKINLNSKNIKANNLLIPHIKKMHDILIPHLQNLQKVIKLNQYSILSIIDILHHAKTQYITFWIYCQLLVHLPSKQIMLTELRMMLSKYCKNIKQILQSNKQLFQCFMDNIWLSKAANIIPVEYYSDFIVLMISSNINKIFTKIIFCFLLYLKNGIYMNKSNSVKYLESSVKNLNIDWKSIFQASVNLAQIERY